MGKFMVGNIMTWDWMVEKKAREKRDVKNLNM